MQDTIPKPTTWPTGFNNCGFWKTDDLSNFNFVLVLQNKVTFLRNIYQIYNSMNLSQFCVIFSQDINLH